MLTQGVWLLGQVGFMVTVAIHLVLMLMKVLRIKTQVYRARDDRAVVDAVMEKMKPMTLASSTRSIVLGDDPVPTGLVVGKWFLAFVERVRIGEFRGSEVSYDIKIVGLSVFEPDSGKKSGDDDDDDKKGKKPVIIETIVKADAHLNAHMRKSKKTCYHQELVEQRRVASEFIGMAKRSKKNGFPFNFIGLVMGPPGTGKSVLGEIIARKTGGILCDEYNPTQYGQSVATLIKVANPTAKKPLVLVLNEIDQWYTYPKETAAAKASDWLTRDIDPTNPKASSNAFFDKLAWKDNVIVVLTTNKTKEELDEIDGFGSLFRKGRVSEYYELEHVIADEMVDLRYSHPSSASGELSDGESDDDNGDKGGAEESKKDN